MTAVHESADSTFQTICTSGWADDQAGYDHLYKLTITLHELPDFVDEFQGHPEFDSALLARVIREGGPYFIVRRNAYGTWHVDQYATCAERNQVYYRLVRDNGDTGE